ncbi:MAG: macro domain-containing protein [Bacteroidales bacterium]
MVKKYQGIDFECVSGDITAQQDIEAVVNAANARLLPGGGVAGAIHRAAGSGLVEECLPLAPIKPGEAVITRGHNLPNSHVIHCLGPVYGVDKPEDKLLAACYRNALLLADENKIGSIAFPSISTGAFGYPLEAAAEVVISTIKSTMEHLKFVKIIRMVTFSETDLRVYKEKTANKFDS